MGRVASAREGGMTRGRRPPDSLGGILPSSGAVRPGRRRLCDGVMAGAVGADRAPTCVADNFLSPGSPRRPDARLRLGYPSDVGVAVSPSALVSAPDELLGSPGPEPPLAKAALSKRQHRGRELRRVHRPPPKSLVEWKEQNGHSPDTKVFCTVGYPRLVAECLLERGWVESPDSSTLFFDAKFALEHKDIPFDNLVPGQLVNYLRDVDSTLGTKVSINKSMKSANWPDLPAGSDSFFPRCFDTMDHRQFAAFEHDFRLTKCQSVLRSWVSANTATRETFSDDVLFRVWRYCRGAYTGSGAEADRDEDGEVILQVELDELGAPTSGVAKRRPRRERAGRSEEDTPIAKASRKDFEEVTPKAARRSSTLARKDTNSLPEVRARARTPTRDSPASKESTSRSVLPRHVKSTDARCSGTGKVDRAQLLEQVSEYLAELAKTNPQYHINGVANCWILKPGRAARGSGIEVSRSWKDIVDLVKKRSAWRWWVAQKYIENPLLVDGRKFDIRQWVMLTSQSDGSLQTWFYGDCLIRFAALEYDPASLFGKAYCEKDRENLRFMHLTNGCITEKHESNRQHDEDTSFMWDATRFGAWLKCGPLPLSCDIAHHWPAPVAGETRGNPKFCPVCGTLWKEQFLRPRPSFQRAAVALARSWGSI
mmetsp:Transcript_39900/g.104561  ORF Transcript_39900/g.104561 Transcript_39900/m.104561 type:complete len:653 (-) Transcript_39900:221-2179(-)